MKRALIVPWILTAAMATPISCGGSNPVSYATETASGAAMDDAAAGLEASGDEIHMNHMEAWSILDGREIDLLAAIIHAEAKGEDLEGKTLVGCVVLNRLDSPDFPDTLEGVAYQRNQFTPAMNGALEKAFGELTDDDYRAAYAAVTDRPDREILYFDGVWPKYGTRAYQHGGHYFCTE